ncbi:hypothetical protein GCM10027436_34690 [Actinophytocola sediminis]
MATETVTNASRPNTCPATHTASTMTTNCAPRTASRPNESARHPAPGVPETAPGSDSDEPTAVSRFAQALTGPTIRPLPNIDPQPDTREFSRRRPETGHRR